MDTQLPRQLIRFLRRYVREIPRSPDKLRGGRTVTIVKEITFQILFRGDFLSCYELAINSKILPPIRSRIRFTRWRGGTTLLSIEEFGLRLIEHFLKNNPQVGRSPRE